jgi:hypothetical protein
MEMVTGILGIAGFVFAATALSVLVYEYQADVLHGPYIEGRAQSQWEAAMLAPVLAMFEPYVERLNWKARNAIYLASLA